MNHARLFEFESDFVASLRCIPMAVRFKLDRCGVKLSLRQWSRLTAEDRRALLQSVCQAEQEVAAYRQLVLDFVMARVGETSAMLDHGLVEKWSAMGPPPRRLADHARSQGLAPPTEAQWIGLTDLERFALLKLSRDNHDNVNFRPAMAEFGLVAPSTAS